MNIKIREVTTPTIIRFVVLVVLALVGGFGVAQQVQAAQTPVNYCNQYPADSGESYMRSACLDGLKIADGRSEGASCQDYAQLADQATVAVCTKALNDRVATASGAMDIVSGGEVIQDTTSPSPTPTQSTSSSPNSISGSIQDALDATQGLSDFIDVLHKVGTDANANMDKPDNEYGKYINGAGNKQKIKVYENPNSKGNAPALVIINGGGWHANDDNSTKIMTNASDVNGRTQVGPTPLERGYVGFDLTYRLGSSGVYYMFEDVMRGIKHIRENAEMYGIDPNKITLWGDSSGGSLATRAGASGKSGAKAVVGWSPPTNAYTALFRSYKSLMIGMDHSTCIPTDLAGAANITDLLNGGSGDVAEYGQGLASNDFSLLGISPGGTESDPLSTVLQVLTAGQYAFKTGQNIESISQQLEAAANGGEPSISSISGSGLSSGIINMSSKKLIECIDNFNALSPALFASPDSPPMYLAGFNTDDVINPNQVTGMRDKLETLGIKTDSMLIDGTNHGSSPLGPNVGNHLDYDARFVCPTLNFVDSVVQPDRSPTNCETGQTENLGSAGGSGGSGGGSCSARVDSEIRIRNIQSVDLAAVVVPSPTKPGAGTTNEPIPGKDKSPTGNVGTGAGKSIDIGTGNTDGKNKPSTSTNYNDPLNDARNKNKTPTEAGTKSTTSGGSSGSGGGGSSGGSGCQSTGGAGSGASAPVAADPNKSETKDPLSQLGDLAGQLGNLAGAGGFGGSKEPSVDSGSSNPGNVDGGGKKEDANGARGGAKFTASKTSGSCQIDYTRAPQATTGGNNLVAICGEKLSFISSVTSDVIHAKPIQMLVVPADFSDAYLKKDACSNNAVAYAFHASGRIYYCSEYLKNNPNDRGMAIHEVAHLTQGYKDAPGWVTEGVADFVRYKYEPKAADRIGCSAGDTYTSGYSCSASLFAYVERQYKKPELIKNIHTQAKAGNFTLSLITSGTGKNIDQLYTECLKPGGECNISNRAAKT